MLSTASGEHVSCLQYYEKFSLCFVCSDFFLWKFVKRLVDSIFCPAI